MIKNEKIIEEAKKQIEYLKQEIRDKELILNNLIKQLEVLNALEEEKNNLT